MNYKIAYIDEDEGWLNTFYQSFKNRFEIELIKIEEDSTIEDVLERIKSSSADGVVTDFALDESGHANFNGNAIVDAIRKVSPHFPIIMLTSYQPQAISQMDDVNIINGKDDLDGDGSDKVEILGSKIETNIDRHYHRIEKTRDRIEILVEKRAQGILTPSEEEELTKLFILTDELNPDGKGVPANFINNEAITAISDFAKDTRAILAELRKQG